MIVHPRSYIGTPEPPASRTKLDRVESLLAHHVGVSISITSRYQDPAKELSDAKAAAAWGVSSGRPWEYSYMIGLAGSIFEQAGVYMAAHCKNFNTESGGVLFLNADEVQVTDAQVESWHWLRGEMVRLGTLSPDHEVAPHYRYRDTSCPGIRAQPPGGPWSSPTGQGRMGNLIPALLDPPAPPTLGGATVTTTSEWQQARIGGDAGFVFKGDKLVRVPQAAGKKAVTVNLHVVTPNHDGFITAFLGPRPATSTVNYKANEISDGTVTVPVDADGWFALYSSGYVKVLVDLVGVHW